jgi:hypothetical protein
VIDVEYIARFIEAAPAADHAMLVDAVWAALSETLRDINYADKSAVREVLLTASMMVEYMRTSALPHTVGVPMWRHVEPFVRAVRPAVGPSDYSFTKNTYWQKSPQYLVLDGAGRAEARAEEDRYSAKRALEAARTARKSAAQALMEAHRNFKHRVTEEEKAEKYVQDLQSAHDVQH